MTAPRRRTPPAPHRRIPPAPKQHLTPVTPPPEPPPPARPAQPDWLTVAEVAKTLRVSPMAIYRLVHSKELPSAKVGNSIRIRRADADAYIRKALGWLP